MSSDSRPGGKGLSDRGGSSTSGGRTQKGKRDAILDLAKYVDQQVRVKFTGGREVVGVLKGYDQLLNLVLDDVLEQRSAFSSGQRRLGLVILRGTTIVVVNPIRGSEEIANPFVEAQ